MKPIPFDRSAPGFVPILEFPANRNKSCQLLIKIGGRSASRSATSIGWDGAKDVLLAVRTNERSGAPRFNCPTNRFMMVKTDYIEEFVPIDTRHTFIGVIVPGEAEQVEFVLDRMAGARSPGGEFVHTTWLHCCAASDLTTFLTQP